ncbi:hypothetical protein NPIL_296261, partial [Nephila pilipes]
PHYLRQGWGGGQASSPIVYGSTTPFVRVSEDRGRGGWSSGSIRGKNSKEEERERDN